MTVTNPYPAFVKLCAALFIAGLIYYGNAEIFTIIYIGLFIAMALRAVSLPSSRKRLRFALIASYSALLPVQLMICEGLGSASAVAVPRNLLLRALCLLGLVIPFTIERFFIISRNESFYMPSLHELSTFSFNELLHSREKIVSAINELQKMGHALSPENIERIAADIPRHNSFRYINDGTLTDDYFKEAYASLDDPHVYIVISNTGSAASEVISVFTKKLYNHVSLSFDADLKTIISYNGGEQLYPPGLNQEMITYFKKKADASIIVYALAAPDGRKRMIIDKIKEINTEGSAYNLFGLVLKYSHRDNIMFCSQFVYKMLRHAGLQYFDMPDSRVRPSDLVELDYYRKLRYAYEIKF